MTAKTAAIQDKQQQQFSMDLTDAAYAITVKAPKLLIGPLELGAKASYTIPTHKDAARNSVSAVVSVKDVLIRGKFEVNPSERKLQYSKKLRLPFLNTELFRVRLTAQLPRGAAPAPASAGSFSNALVPAANSINGTAPGSMTGPAPGSTCSTTPALVAPPPTPAATRPLFLGSVLSLTLQWSTDPLYRGSVVRSAPDYSIRMQPRIGLPQVAYDKMGFPGSVYVKADTTLRLSDAASAKDVGAHLDVHRVRAVVRLYDAGKVKPCRMGRNLTAAARRLGEQDFGEDLAAWRPRGAQAADEEDGAEPDIIDKAAAKAREWTHAVLVNSCIATKHLQEQAAAAGDWWKAKAEGKPVAKTA